MFFSKIALGVDWSADGLKLVALGRRFRKLVVLDSLRAPDPPTGETKSQVEEFLKRNHAAEARVIACLPREAFLVRFLDLPAEAESQLDKVIGYQVDTLHPYQANPIRWDRAVVGRDTKTKQVRVMVVIAEQSVLDRKHQVLRDLGLRVDSLTLAAAPLAALLRASLPEAALVVLGRGERIELLGFRQGGLVATQELAPAGDGEPAPRSLGVGGPAQQLERELHALGSVLPEAVSTAVPTFTSGTIPEAFAEVLVEPKRLPPPTLPLAAPEKFDLDVMLPALAAAHAALRRNPSPAINLLPVEQRVRPSQWGPVPVYALGASAVLMALMLVAHGFIERAFYGRALGRQIARLSSQAEAARRQSQQVARLSERAALLESLRAETWQKLQILEELTRLLPDGTWVGELQIGQGTVEFSGFSNRAADLIQPLESSPYFSQVEFTSPITGGGANKEAFRIRMRLGKPARP